MRNFKHNFTLVELLVSLGIFSILLVVFMQIFSGMRLSLNNVEQNTEAQQDSSLCLNIASQLLESISCVNVEENVGGTAKKVPFPFYVTRTSGSSDSSCNIYFATKARLDNLTGSNPVRFVALLYPHADNKLGVDDADLNKIYLTVLSNAAVDGAGKDVSADNRDIYHKFWPAPEFDGYDNPSAARTGLSGYLNAKAKKPAAGKVLQRSVLLENVTEFKVKLYDANGNEVGATASSAFEVPESLELTVSVLPAPDFEIWSKMAAGDAKLEFQRAKQLTSSRRIYIGDRWSEGGNHEKY